MTDTPDEQEVPDFYEPELECHAHQNTRTIIGVPPHTHVCRDYPDHQGEHTCHACGHNWPKRVAA